MPSKLGTKDVDSEELIGMDRDGQLRRSLLEQQVSRIPKEFLTDRGSSKKKLQDKGNSLISGKAIELKSLDQHGTIQRGCSTPPTRFRNYQKPWPSRKTSRHEELVKHMSNVPCYLQHIDRDDNVQGKALHVGVLDWCRLEKWTHNQKSVANGKGGYCPTSTIMTSPCSSCGSSTESHRSSSSPLSQRKQSPSLKAGRSASGEGCPTWTMEEGKAIDFRHKLEKCRIKNSVLKDTSSNLSRRQSDGTSLSKDLKTFVSRSNREKEKPQCCGNLDMHRDWALDKCLTENIEGMWDRLQEDAPGRHSSFESTTFKDASPIEVKHYHFSRELLPEDVQFTDLSPLVPHSCPVPSTIVTDEPHAVTTFPYENEVLTARLKNEHANEDCFSGFPCELFGVSISEKLGRHKTKISSSVERGLSPNHQYSAGLNWMGRSSCLTEGSPNRQIKETACSDNLNADKASINSRGRRSPLRRILDPLLKPMNRINFSGSIAGHHVHELKKTDKSPIQATSTQGPRKSSDENANASSNTQGSCQKEKHRASMKQALLQLAWKNGLPLLTLSSADSDILAATIRKRNDSIKDDVECIYTIFIIREVKKKSGIWTNHRRNGKTHGLVSNVVGHIKVSHLKLTSCKLHSHSGMREFVLLSAELAHASHETIGPGISSELAAIVVKDPDEFPKNSVCGMLRSDDSRDSTQIYSADDNSCNYHAEGLKMDLNARSPNLPSIFAILPTAVHGLSAEGEPSTLIERWKSGGSCDCGGWDEGCMLTILCDKHQDSVEAHDRTQQIELFIQDGYRETRHAFSMESSKGGMYAVVFKPSIALLQAFAICIATLHSRRPPNHLMAHCSTNTNSIEEDLFADHARMATPTAKEEDAAAYVRNHPPLSPFGRA